jgi:hypothetical protein
MKKHCIGIIPAVASIAAILCITSCTALPPSDFTLTVMNPRGEITLPPVSPPSDRMDNLSGRRIGLYWNEKQGGIHFWNGIEALLKEKLPGVTVLRFSGAFDLGDAMAERMAGEIDAFFYGVGD